MATVLLHVAAGQLTTLASYGAAAVTCDGTAIPRPANTEPAAAPSTAVQAAQQAVGTSVVFICAKGFHGWKGQTGCPNLECVRRGVVNWRCGEDGAWEAQGGVEDCRWRHVRHFLAFSGSFFNRKIESLPLFPLKNSINQEE